MKLVFRVRGRSRISWGPIGEVFVFVLIVGVVALVGKLVEGALLRERIRVRLEHLAERRVAKLLLRHGGDGGRHLDGLYLVVASKRGGFAAGFVIFGLGFTMEAAA